MYLPPYSPNFNPIKAYFKDLKRHIRHQYQYKIDDFNSNKKFTKFLFSCTKEVRQHTKAIKGHFCHAQVPERRSKASDHDKGR